MASRPSLPSLQRVTLPKLTEDRFPDEYCSTVKLFISLMLEPTPNTLTAEVRKLEAIARFLASRSSEKDRRLGSSPWGETQCGHSLTSRSSWSPPSPTR